MKLGPKFGHIVTEETRKKLSLKNKGRKLTPEQCETRRKNALKYGSGKWMKGKKLSSVTRLKQSESASGNNHWNWKDGQHQRNILIRYSIEYRLWREAVFARDNWTCNKCRVKGGKLNAHHVKRFSLYPELRFAIDNGVTLCKSCHKEVHRKKVESN